LVVGVPAAHWVWFVLVPRAVVPRLARGDREREKRYLRAVIATPAMAAGGKILARFLLLARCQRDRQYHEAAELARAVLRVGRLKPGLESTIRQHLADCLDGLGRREAADAERARADEVLKGSKETFIEGIAQGKLLDREHRYDEACRAYERGLG